MTIIHPPTPTAPIRITRHRQIVQHMAQRGRCCFGETRLKTGSQEAKQAPREYMGRGRGTDRPRSGQEATAMSGISSRCRCLARETPHAQHHDTLWAWHGRGLRPAIRPCQAPLQQCATWFLAPSPCPVPYASANQTRRPTASSFLGGKRCPASRISSSVDGRTHR
jgi:hypothetical protein